MGNTLTLLTPVGIPPALEMKPLAPRLEGLRGKRIAFYNVIFDSTGLFFEQLQAWFRDNMSDVEIFMIDGESPQEEEAARTGSRFAEGPRQIIRDTADAAIVALGI